MKIIENGNKYTIMEDNGIMHLYSYERELAKIDTKKNIFELLETDFSKTNIRHVLKFKEKYYK